MISADTSVWIELLRGTGSSADLELRRLIEDDAGVVISEVVITEILKGFEDEGRAQEAEQSLLGFPIVSLRSPDDFILAASLHRLARRAGFAIRSTIDCLIAAPCIREGIPLLHADADFDRLASCSDLTIYPV